MICIRICTIYLHIKNLIFQHIASPPHMERIYGLRSCWGPMQYSPVTYAKFTFFWSMFGTCANCSVESPSLLRPLLPAAHNHLSACGLQLIYMCVWESRSNWNRRKQWKNRNLLFQQNLLRSGSSSAVCASPPVSTLEAYRFSARLWTANLKTMTIAVDIKLTMWC